MLRVRALRCTLGAPRAGSRLVSYCQRRLDGSGGGGAAGGGGKHRLQEFLP